MAIFVVLLIYVIECISIAIMNIEYVFGLQTIAIYHSSFIIALELSVIVD